MIGRQRIEIDLNPGSFRRELSRARTFGFMKDVERLWAAGLALGASLENTVAIGDDRIINREGLRYSDEFVRHKALDAVGDLALAGAPILGAFTLPPRWPSPQQPRAEGAVRRCRGLDPGRSSAAVPRGSPRRAQPPPGGSEFRGRAELGPSPPSSQSAHFAARWLAPRVLPSRVCDTGRWQRLADGGHEQKNTIISGAVVWLGFVLRSKLATRGKSASFGFRRNAKRSSLHKRLNGGSDLGTRKRPA